MRRPKSFFPSRLNSTANSYNMLKSYYRHWITATTLKFLVMLTNYRDYKMQLAGRTKCCCHCSEMTHLPGKKILSTANVSSLSNRFLNLTNYLCRKFGVQWPSLPLNSTSCAVDEPLLPDTLHTLPLIVVSAELAKKLSPVSGLISNRPFLYCNKTAMKLRLMGS